MRRIAIGALAVLCATAAGCARTPPPPYRLNFSLSGASPRILVSGNETLVDLAVANTGERAWDPARIHISYHWLWLLPRESASRARWNFPYQEGIRTELAAPVPPGASARVRGRLLAPSAPGLYWLQWDMVEEGGVWFAQAAPRQPRTLVVVVPPLVWVLAPIPLIVALLGWRRPPIAVWWCAAVLFCKPFIVIHDALLEPTAVAYWLMAAVAVVIPAAALRLPRRPRAWTLVAIGIFASLLLLADVVYYRFFGDVLSTSALLGAHQAGRVWGSIRSLFSPGLVWLVADWPVAIWTAARLSRRPDGPERAGRSAIAAGVALAAVAVAGLLVSAPRVLASTPLDQMFRNRAVMEQLGPFAYHAYDTWNYARARWFRPPVTAQAVDDAVAFFAGRAALRSGAGTAAFGAARGRSVLVVQVESLQDFVVDLVVDGQEVMPHLRRWSADAMRFTNVTDETSEGRTSDAEFATMVSLLPLDHGAVAFRYPANHYVPLPRVLRDGGYATLSAVPFEPGFWNREVMHPAYGFERSLFEPDFQMTEQIGWGLNDRDFLQQMVPRLERLRRPFLAWMITLSLHHPFEDFPAAHKVLRLGALEGTSFGNYLHAMRFFDDALEAFRTALARDGLLDDSVVVVFGDHDAGFAQTPAMAAAMHLGSDDAAWLLNDRVPWFIRLPTTATGRGSSRLAGDRTMPAGQTDFAPTLLALLGIDAARLPYVGRNLLGAPGDAPIVRPYGDWIDSRHAFFGRGAERVCVDVARRTAVDAGACAAGDGVALRTHDVSRLVVTEDLQERIADRLVPGR